MKLAIIINSIVCVVGTVVGLLFAGASIISIANMTVPWREWLIGAAFLVPAMFLISGLGTWLVYVRGLTYVAFGLMALPWVYAMLFILLMLVSFES